MNSLECVYNTALLNNGFFKQNTYSLFNRIGSLYNIPKEFGQGFYWFYSFQDSYIIKIHDFYLYNDAELDFNFSNCLNICYYDSISALEVDSNRVIKSGFVKSYYGDEKTVKTKIFKDVPIRSIEIEITPSGLNECLKNSSINVLKMDKIEAFPEIVELLLQIPTFNGDGPAASLFFESKIKEALSLILLRESDTKKATKVISSDEKSLDMAIALIEQNPGANITTESLCKVTCMGKTKFNCLFKEKYGMTPTNYIKICRLNKAKNLLLKTDKTIQEVSAEVGFTNPGRFSKYFKEYFGEYPSEVR